MNILFSWLSIPRMIGIWIDTIAFSLVDNAYNLIVFFAGASFFENGAIKKIMNSIYVIISLFALFRLALLLVNAMISPDKLYDNKVGIGKIGLNVVIMFVLLIITPTIFRYARELQTFVVEKDIIGRMFGLGVANFSTYTEDGNSEKKDDGYNPGIVMQKMVINSLIYPDEEFYDSETNEINTETCTGKCPGIIEDYNTMMGGDYNVDYAWLSRQVTVSLKVNDKEVYVLHYYFIVTLAVAGFIVYILFSFAIDISVRSVELAALEILSPLFIVTYIDPKSATSGPFHNWLTTTLKTYVSLFIKLAIISLMLVLVTLANNIKLPSGGGLFAKILMLFGILIFAKKAPTWISNMIGVKDAGIGGLSIGKKLGGAALIGGATASAISKGKNALTGAGLGAVKNAHAARKAKKLGLSDAGDRARNRVRDAYKENRNNNSEGRLKSAASAIGQTYFKEAGKNMKNWGNTFAAGASGVLTGVIQGAKDGSSAKDVKDINSKTSATAKATLERYAPGYQSIPSKIGEKANKTINSIADNRFGGRDAVENKVYDVQKEKEGMKTAKKMYGDTKVMTDNGKRKTLVNPVDRKEANQMINSVNGQLANNATLASGIASIFGTSNFSGTNVEGLCTAFLTQRLKKDDSGNVVRNNDGSYVLDNGATLKIDRDSNGRLGAVIGTDERGNNIVTSFSDYCTRAESGRILTEGGLANFATIAQANAITNADRVITNNQQISNANQQAAAANDQMMTFMNNVKSMSADASRAIDNLVNAMKQNTLSTNQYNDVMRGLNISFNDLGDEQRRLMTQALDLDTRINNAVSAEQSGHPLTDANGNPINIDELREQKAECEERKNVVDSVISETSSYTDEQKDAMRHYEALYGTDGTGASGAIGALDSIPGLMPGTSASFMATINLRDEATETSRKLTAENEKIKTEIKVDIDTYGDSSYYKPEDFDGTHTQDFLESVEKGYVKERMTAAKEKAEKKKDRLLSDDKDKK